MVEKSLNCIIYSAIPQDTLYMYTVFSEEQHTHARSSPLAGGQHGCEPGRYEIMTSTNAKTSRTLL